MSDFKWSDLTFVILRHVKSEDHDRYWKRCVWSVNQNHPDCRVIVIDDNSPYQSDVNVQWKKQDLKYELIKSDLAPEVGELLPYYYYLINQWSPWMIILHDSMFMVRPLESSMIKNATLWWFKGDPWFQPGQTMETIRKLRNYGSLNQKYLEKGTWKGCFGSCCVISIEKLKQLEINYGFPTMLTSTINTRQRRMMLERIVGLFISENLFGEVHSLPGLWKQMPMDLYESTILLPNIEKVPPVVKQWVGR